MNIQVNGKPRWITWMYHEVLSRKGQKTISTECQLKLSPKEEPIAVAFSIKSVNDQHCKETARKSSLAKLLKALGLSREQRIEVWIAYFGRVGKQITIKSQKQHIPTW